MRQSTPASLLFPHVPKSKSPKKSKVSEEEEDEEEARPVAA